MTCALSFLLLGSVGAQQPGDLDQTFNPGDTLIGQGNGPYVPDATPLRMAVLPDGRVMLAGSLNNYNGMGSPGLARVLPNGLADPTFSSGLAANTIVNALALEPDGQVVYATIGGVFRRNADGSADTGFNDGSGPGGGQVRAIAVQPDGRIIVAGQFSTFNGAPRARIARLNSDGSLDEGFTPGLAFNNTIWSISITSSGQIVTGGAFTNTGYALVARLNSSGSLDAGFVPPSGMTGVINDVVALTNGQVLIGGSFEGTDFADLGRLTSTGSRDVSLTWNFLSGADPVRKIVPYADGRFLVVGNFGSYAGEAVGCIMRVLPNGTRDTSFQPNGGFPTGVESPWTAAVLPSGGILVADGRRYRDVPCPRLVKLAENGDRDMSFNRITGQNIRPSRIIALSDGKILVSGANVHQGEVYPGLIRLLANGDRDPGFNIGVGPGGGQIQSMLPLADGRMIVCGTFTTFSGLAVSRVVRLLASGAIDPTFNVGAGPNNGVSDVQETADGKLLLIGSFTSFNGTAVNGLVRLHADGAMDLGFTPPATNGLISNLALSPGGKVVISGTFTTVGTSTRNRIARLLAEGALDPAFDPGAGPNTVIASLAVQPDGRVVACGMFTSVAGVSRNHVARFSNDGSLDASFDPGSAFAGSPQIPVRVRLQPDGRVLVGGAFYTYDGHSQEALIRLETDGSVDLTFQGDGFHIHHRGLSTWNYSQVVDMSVQTDGKILVVGYFDSYGPDACNTIARLHGGSIAGVALAVKAMLQGPVSASGTSMSIALKQAGVLPVTEPYTDLGYVHAGGGGGESFDPVALNSLAITDWVIVELRSEDDASLVVRSHSCLLRSNGSLVDADAVTATVNGQLLDLVGVAPGGYYVAVRHRNHLGAMTAAPVPLSAVTTTIDLTDPTTLTWGTAARNNVNGHMVLWPGDANGDGVVQYTGNGNDRDPILAGIGGIVPTNVVGNVYSPLDVNMNAEIKYTGTNNDRDVILQTIGGAVPTATRTQQLP